MKDTGLKINVAPHRDITVFLPDPGDNTVMLSDFFAVLSQLKAKCRAGTGGFVLEPKDALRLCAEIGVDPLTVKHLCSHVVRPYNPIGTGPWPDYDDTGDPPDTEPLGRPKIGKKPLSSKVTGHSCRKCKTFNEYAESNQKDGTYVCFECR